jgi:O-antigen/teichoic acid export membrane protein
MNSRLRGPRREPGQPAPRDRAILQPARDHNVANVFNIRLSLSGIRQSKTAHTIAVFATGNTVAMLLGVVGSLVQARYLAPEDMGVLRTFGIVAGYLTFLHLGVFDGLQRELPLQLGRGNRAQAEQAASASLAWIILVSLACGAIFLVLALRAAYHGEWMQFWGWLAYTPVIVATFYGGYLGTTFRSGQQFIVLSQVSVIQAIAGTLVLPLFPIMGYFGACLRMAVSSVTNIFFLHRWRPLRVRPVLDWPSFREVIRIGLPFSGIGYLGISLWVSLEGTLVLAWFGIKMLGLYSLALFVRTLVVQLALNLNQVLTVKVFDQYGRTNRVTDCVHLIIKPMAVAFVGSIPLVTAGWFVLPWAIRLFVPAYVEATLMMQIMLFMLPITFLRLPSAIMWATGRRLDCLVVVATGFSVFIGCSWLLYRLNVGVLSVVIASIIGVTIVILGYWLLIWRLIFRERHESINPARNEQPTLSAI